MRRSTSDSANPMVLAPRSTPMSRALAGKTSASTVMAAADVRAS
jgi:hypothetical protein